MDTASLLKSIKRRARLFLVSLPAGQNQEFLDIMNETFDNTVLPEMLAMREEFYVHGITWNTEQNQTIQIPSDAIGAKVRGIYLLDNEGKIQRPVPFRNIDTVYQYESAANGWYTPGIILRNNTLETKMASCLMQVAYYKMPNKLILFDETAPQATASQKVYQVLTVAGSNLTLNNPAPLTSTGTPVVYDVIEPGYPHNKRGSITVTFTSPFNANPQTATYVGGVINTFTGETLVPDVGDWLFLPNQTGFANIPREVELYFILATAAAILNFQGAAEFTQVQQEANEQLRQVQMLLDPRNDGSPWTLTDNRGLSDFT